MPGRAFCVMSLFALRPVLYIQPVHPSEFPGIICHQRHPLRHGVGCYLGVQGAYGGAFFLQGGADLAVDCGGDVIEMEDAYAGREHD